MGREVRMVPADWVHPKYTWGHPDVAEKGYTYLVGRYIPMHNSSFDYAYETWKNEDLPEWEETRRHWEDGYVYNAYSKTRTPIEEYIKKWDAEKNDWQQRPDPPTFAWWAGDKPTPPKPEWYMPDWPDSERTHYMMYESTSEGTPISPAFATPEELAHWLADTGASSFADFTATYEQWLAAIKAGSAVSAVLDSTGLRSGVEDMD